MDTARDTISDPAALTPVEFHGGVWFKRDDMYQVAGMRGGKARACHWLATKGQPRGLVTAGGRGSPQVEIVAAIARHLGLPCRVHVPAGTATPEMLRAQAAGAELVPHRPGYNSVLCARAAKDAALQNWRLIPFGMQCFPAVSLTTEQSANIPASIQRLIVPVGSGVTLAGILHGLARQHAYKLPFRVIGVVVGANPTRCLDQFAPLNWCSMVTLVRSRGEYGRPATMVRYHDVPLDPYYEAKCLPYLLPGDLLWVVGHRGGAQ